MGTVQPATRSITTSPDVASAERTPAVKVWALAGGLVLVFIAWVLIRWITGPFFQRVPPGPTPLSGGMKANLLFWQIVSPIAALSLIGALVIRPWLRDRTISTDGCFVLAFSTLWFQDPLCNFTGSWVTYNSWMFNRGSWVSSVPGSASFAAPGHMLAEPLLLIPFLYVYFFWLACIVGSAIMRRIATSRPQAGKLVLISGCFVIIAAFDFVLEGLIWMPGGAWTLAGGTAPVLFKGTFHQFTVNEWIPVSATLTAVACVRYFKDDNGRTIAERGLDTIKTTPRRKLGLQILAIIGVTQLCMFVFYVSPNFIFGLHTKAWPVAVQQRSYFTDGICGQDTDRACPSPNLPITQNNDTSGGPSSAFINRAGDLQFPSDAKAPKPVPFQR